MAPLNPAAALAASANVDVELTVDGFARDLNLKLLSDVGLVQAAATRRAGIRQGRLVDLVDLFWRRWSAVSLRAVLRAGLAAWRLGIWLGRSLGERTGLTPAGTPGVLELLAERLELRLQIGKAALQRSAAGTGNGFHTLIVPNDLARQLRQLPIVTG
jgi:hypothetical protein